MHLSYSEKQHIMMNGTQNEITNYNENNRTNLQYELYDPTYFEADDTVFILKQVILPVICILGFLGNSFAAITFLGPSLKNSPCSIYLAVRSMSDNGFIITLFIVWLDHVDVRLFHKNGMCQITLFLSYICGFVSVWCVVFVTVENYIRVCHPTKVGRFCTKKISQYMVFICFIFSALLYNFPLWGTEIQSHEGQTFCMTMEQYTLFQEILTYVDTVLTLFLPLLIILCLMVLILCSAIEASKRQKKWRSYQRSSRSISGSRSLPYIKVTRLLSSVSVVFLILHTPVHLLRIIVMFEYLIHGPSTVTNTDRNLQHIFSTIYYLNYSINCLLYLICGSNFRKIFCSTVCGKVSKLCSMACEEETYEDERLSSGLTTSSTLMIDKEEETKFTEIT